MAKTGIKFTVALVLFMTASHLRVIASGGWFEEAPPLLPYYLDRLPAKSFGQVYLETRKKTPELPPPDTASINKVIFRLSTEEPKALIPRVDELLMAARQNYENGDWSNLLYDIRDALLSGAKKSAIIDYLHWRVEHADWFKVQKSDSNYPPPTPDPALPDRRAELEKHIEDASAELKPNWIYLRGALAFRTGARGDGERWFDRVCMEFPSSPRAEVALFMRARCEFALSRMDSEEELYNPDSISQKRKQQNLNHAKNAIDLFRKYLEQYPQGVFTADVYGWLGALCYNGNVENGRVEALKNYILQLQSTDHPEVAKSALFMCERIMRGATAKDEEIFRLIAENPVIAMGSMYFMVEARRVPGSSGNYDGSEMRQFLTDAASIKKWRQEVLPALAAAVAARSDLYQSREWASSYLALLAQAASATGNQEEALKITQIPPKEIDGSDDLLLARGTAFQREEKLRDAIAAYRMLLEKFPKSPLARGTRLKLALALLDSHEAGLALIELKQLKDSLAKDAAALKDYNYEPYPSTDAALTFSNSVTSPDISGAQPAQINQLIDTIHNFAPLSEIESCLLSDKVDEAFKNDIRDLLAQRYLSQEDFSSAKKFMTDAQFQLTASHLDQLTKSAVDAKSPRAKAEAMSRLANAWAEARGKVLKLPLDGPGATGIFEDDAYQAGIHRHENGQALGFKNTAESLEMRDELLHAFQWWLRAADAAPKTQIAASARWKALETMPQIVDASGFAFQRAIETQAGDRSRKIYDALRTLNPDSKEAKKYAVYWNFTDGENKFQKDDYLYIRRSWPAERGSVGKKGYAYPAYGLATGDDYDGYDGNVENEWSDIHHRIITLNALNWDKEHLIAEVDDLVRQARSHYSSLNQAYYLNFLEDIAFFLKEPNITPEMFRAYIELRLRFNGFLPPSDKDKYSYDEGVMVQQDSRLQELMKAPILNPVMDYIDFMKAAAKGKQHVEIAGKDSSFAQDLDKDSGSSIRTVDYWSMAQAMRDFLAKYPKSAKREAAALMLARSAHWLNTPLLFVTDAQDQNVEPVTKTFWRQKFDSRQLLATLDAYDREFPNGRYAAEIRDWRADAAWQKHDWNMALDLTLAEMEDPSHPDLHPLAALRLANIFGTLTEEQYRTAIIDCLRKNPKALKYLQKYLASIASNPDHPLRYMRDYLSDQLGLSQPLPQKKSSP